MSEKLVVELDQPATPALEAPVDVQLGEQSAAETRPMTPEELAQHRANYEASNPGATPQHIEVSQPAVNPDVIDVSSRPAS